MGVKRSRRTHRIRIHWAFLRPSTQKSARSKKPYKNGQNSPKNPIFAWIFAPSTFLGRWPQKSSMDLNSVSSSRSFDPHGDPEGVLIVKIWCFLYLIPLYLAKAPPSVIFTSKRKQSPKQIWLIHEWNIEILEVLLYKMIAYLKPSITQMSWIWEKSKQNLLVCASAMPVPCQFCVSAVQWFVWQPRTGRFFSLVFHP